MIPPRVLIVESSVLVGNDLSETVAEIYADAVIDRVASIDPCWYDTAQSRNVDLLIVRTTIAQDELDRLLTYAETEAVPTIAIGEPSEIRDHAAVHRLDAPFSYTGLVRILETLIRDGELPAPPSNRAGTR